VPAAAFQAYAHFADCCAAADCLASRRTVLLQPVAFTLRTDKRAEPRGAALAFFSRTVAMLCEAGSSGGGGGGAGGAPAPAQVRARLEGIAATLAKGVAPVAALLPGGTGGGGGGGGGGGSGRGGGGSCGERQPGSKAAEQAGAVAVADALAACCAAAAGALPPGPAGAHEWGAAAGAVAGEALAVCDSLLAAGSSGNSSGDGGGGGGGGGGGESPAAAVAARLLPALSDCVPLLAAAAAAGGSDLGQWLLAWERSVAQFGAPAMRAAAAQLQEAGRLEDPDLLGALEALCAVARVRESGLQRGAWLTAGVPRMPRVGRCA
jgi:hypothetical protein